MADALFERVKKEAGENLVCVKNNQFLYVPQGLIAIPCFGDVTSEPIELDNLIVEQSPADKGNSKNVGDWKKYFEGKEEKFASMGDLILLAKQLNDKVNKGYDPNSAKIYHHLLDDFIRTGIVSNTSVTKDGSRFRIDNPCMLIGGKKDELAYPCPEIYLDNVPLSEVMFNDDGKSLMIALSKSVWGWEGPENSLSFLSQRVPQHILVNIPKETGTKYVWMGYRRDDFVISIEKDVSGRARSVKYK